MDSVPQRRFACYAYDHNGTRLRYQARAELNGRPQFNWSDIINKRVCWQYFNETLNTSMIRYGENEYGVAGNSTLTFYCDDPEQPPFKPESARSFICGDSSVSEPSQKTRLRSPLSGTDAETPPRRIWHACASID